MTTATKHGLGRGLNALIPARAQVENQAQNSVRHVQTAHIEPNPHQPRKQIAHTALAELAASIREHGLIQPLLLKEISTPYGPRYQLIAGERRWRAAVQAGLDVVPAVIKGATPQQMLELALVENVQRADLNALEEAEAYNQLIQEFQLTHDQVAQKVGKDRVTVSNSLRLLRMPEPLRAAVLNDGIREGHARALSQVTDPKKQASLLKRVVEGNLTVRQTEELVRRALGKKPGDRSAAANGGAHGRPAARGTDRVYQLETETLEDNLRRALGTQVKLVRGANGGKLTIEFYSDEELQVIYDKLI
jgi:ParB family chromosome partitioning protein